MGWAHNQTGSFPQRPYCEHEGGPESATCSCPHIMGWRAKNAGALLCHHPADGSGKPYYCRHYSCLADGCINKRCQDERGERKSLGVCSRCHGGAGPNAPYADCRCGDETLNAAREDTAGLREIAANLSAFVSANDRRQMEADTLMRAMRDVYLSLPPSPECDEARLLAYDAMEAVRRGR